MTFASGETVGRYRILRPLGAGAMGVVYLAEDPQIERQLAIKTLRQTLSLAPEDTREAAERRERLLREARTAGRLIHPNVVTLFDAGEHEGTLFLAFEYVEGQSLDKRLASGEGMTTAEALRIAREAATGLAFAHARGVVHRDVKPANLLLAEDGRVKVSDFGIAKMAGQATELTMTGTVVGSPHYLSPEQVRGEALDGRSDLFSLGVVLYELLGGRRPFGGDTLTTLVYQILHQPPPPMPLRPGLAPRLTEVLSWFLAKDRDERYGSAEEAVAALEGLERDLAPEVLAAPAVAAEVLEPTHLLSMTGPLPVPGGQGAPGATRPAELPGEPPGTRPARASGERGAAAAAPAEGAGTGGRRKLWIAAAVVLALLAVAAGVAGVVAVVWFQERAEEREALLAEAPESRDGEDGTGGEDGVSASGTEADEEGDPAPDGSPPERAAPLRSEPSPARTQAPAATGTAPPRPAPTVPPAPAAAPPPSAAATAADREPEPEPAPAAPAEPGAARPTARELREEIRDRPVLRRAVKDLVEETLERFDQRLDTGMSVTFQVQPRDAFVLLDGTVIGRASDHDPRAGGRPFALPEPGLYRVKLRSPGMADHLILLRAQEGAAAPSVVSARMAPAQAAELELGDLPLVRVREAVGFEVHPQSAQEGARVEVDGRPVGRADRYPGRFARPATWLRLPPGRHRVSLLAPGHVRRDYAVDVSAGAAEERERIQVRLEPLDGGG